MQLVFFSDDMLKSNVQRNNDVQVVQFYHRCLDRVALDPQMAIDTSRVSCPGDQLGGGHVPPGAPVLAYIQEQSDRAAG